MSRSAASPRVFQPYSPRYPSPLGLPPLAAPQGSQDIPCSAYPKTPERYYYQHYSEPTSHGMRFPPDVHRRTSNTQRARASPPAPLSLDSHHHPAAFVHLPSIEETLQPHVKQEMHVPPPSPTASSTSSLSLYSTESAKKSLEIGEGGEGEGKKKGGGGGGVFCLCFNFSALFGTKSKSNKILAPQQPQVLVAEPSPAPQMVQPRRRPASLVLVQ